MISISVILSMRNFNYNKVQITSCETWFLICNLLERDTFALSHTLCDINRQLNSLRLGLLGACLAVRSPTLSSRNATGIIHLYLLNKSWSNLLSSNLDTWSRTLWIVFHTFFPSLTQYFSNILYIHYFTNIKLLQCQSEGNLDRFRSFHPIVSLTRTTKIEKLFKGIETPTKSTKWISTTAPTSVLFVLLEPLFSVSIVDFLLGLIT
mmetsp:Transcript_17170/g.32510  ORF Transcript_17170/g.32510 Transcript_17170/m.32510 type:complete len:207 (+) Transcript_17170:482-1102(+)